MTSIRGIGDFATVYQWNITLPSSPITSPIIGASDVEDDFNLRCFSSEVPKRAPVGAQDIWIRGHHVKQPGIYDSTHTLTLVFLETVDSLVASMMKAWRDACWDPVTGQQLSKENLEADVRLVRLNRQDEEIWEYILHGCFYEDGDPTGGTPLDGSTSDIIRPSMILSYDWFEDGAVS